MEPQTSPTSGDAEAVACANCQTPFIPRRSNQKCCDADCRKNYEIQKQQRAKQRQPHTITCGWCEDRFETTRTDRDFCSTPCQQAFNNFWKGWGPRFGKALTLWRVGKVKGAFTAVCRLFSQARAEAKEKKAAQK